MHILGGSIWAQLVLTFRKGYQTIEGPMMLDKLEVWGVGGRKGKGRVKDMTQIV